MNERMKFDLNSSSCHTPQPANTSPLLCPQTSWRYELLSESGKWISARIENCTALSICREKGEVCVPSPLLFQLWFCFFFFHDMQVWLYSWVWSEHGKICNDTQIFRTFELIITLRISSFLDGFPSYILSG